MEEYPQYPNGKFGDAVPRAGNASGGGQPGWILKCKGWETDPNAYIYFITQAPVWKDICEVIGREEWLTDPRYATPKARLPHLMEIFGQIEEWTKTKTKFEAMDILNKHDIPCGPILSMKEIAEEPSLRKTGTVVEVDHPKRGKYLVGRQPDQDVRQPDRRDALAAAWRAYRRGSGGARLQREQVAELRSCGRDLTAHRSRNRSRTQRSTSSKRSYCAAMGGTSNPEERTWRMTKPRVRKILDKVKAEGRTSLTAPEGKLVCDAYGIPVPKEGVATSAAEAAKLASGMGFPVVLKIVSPEILHKTEAGGVLVGVKSADEAEKGFATIMANAKKYDAQGEAPRRPGAADARRRPGGHHRRGHRSFVRQAGRVRPRRHPGRGAQGHHLPPGARIARRRAVDARRHRRGGDTEGRSRLRSGRPRRAGQPDPARVRADLGLSRHHRDGLEPGVRDQERRHRRRRAHRRRFLAAAGALSARATTTSCAT